MKNDSEIENKLEGLKDKLGSGIQSQYHVKKDIEKYLLNRFSSNKGFNAIDLSQAIDRESLHSQISDWWQMQDVPVCYLEGEEGTGKTWLAAKWMNSIHENYNCVAFWLDSKDWQGCKSIFDLFNNCFSLIYLSYKHAKIQNKPAKIWSRTLIVLDGVNERNAIETAQNILNEYFRHESELKDRIRLLFTTRPLSGYPLFKSHLWEQSHAISVLPFNDPELQKALIREKMQPHDLPDSLKEIAKFPRYFNRCIELKEKFGSYNAVTKEMILLADLQHKIEHSDSQIRENLGWTRIEDVRDFLSHLAQQIEWNRIENAPKVFARFLKECFSDYPKTRIDLEEQRITRKAGQFHAELSEDHVLLCWALYLSTLSDCMEFTEVKDLAKGFQSALEPIPSEDLRTEALFVALQISAISPEQDISHDLLSRKRAAMMLAWVNSHNAQITKERISFWVEKDTVAYLQFVEAKFQDQILPNQEEVLIEPLARIWRNKKSQLNDLASRLTKWLQPIYSDEVITGDHNIDAESHQFPTIYSTQIRLATAALSILSQRPERQFLSILARCYAIHEQTPQFNENIGRLMRWGYTETVLGDLYWLAELAKHDEFLFKGFLGLSEDLQVVELPPSLVHPLFDNHERYTRRSIPSIEDIIKCIRNQELLLPADPLEANSIRGYDSLGLLAVRNDLPDLRADDYIKIKEVLQYISENVEWGKNASATLEDSCAKNLTPWFAKNNPQNYSKFACSFMINFLSPDYQVYILSYIQGIIFHQTIAKKYPKQSLKLRNAQLRILSLHLNVFVCLQKFSCLMCLRRV